MSQSFVSKPKVGRKRLPQVPHLITHSNKSKPLPPGKHKFVVTSSATNLLSVTGSHMSEGGRATMGPQHAMPPLPEVGSTTQNQPLNQTSDNSCANFIEVRNYDKELDSFLADTLNMPLHGAIENFMKNHFIAQKSIVWVSIPELQMLYSHSLNSVTAQSQGLVGHTFQTRSLLRCTNPSSHPAYYSQVDSQFCGSSSSVLLFPIIDYKNNLWAIVQITKESSDSSFGQEDEEFAQWFINKFKLLSKWIRPDLNTEGFAAEILDLMHINDYLDLVQTKMMSLFDCNSAEIWKYENSNRGSVTRYTKTIETIDFSKAGIVTESLTKNTTVNCSNVQIHTNYNVNADGKIASAAMAIPITDDGIHYSIVIRGPRHNKLFTKIDETNLKKIAPLILLGLTNSEAFSQFDDDLRESKNEREGLAALLEVVEVISSQLNNEDNLVEVIMEKGRSLTDSDRCSLFLVNEDRDKLKTSLHKGLSQAIELPINKGIAGKTATEGKIFNIPDVYDSQFFDSTIDLASGYKTKSILSVPIYNSRSEIIGVTEMVNKKGNQQFSPWDEKLIQIFNVFCGISLENSRLFNESLEMNNKLSSFFDTAFAMAKSESLQKIFSEIMHNAKQSIGADRASIFLKEEGKEDSLSTFVVDGDKVPNSIPINKGIVGHVASTKTAMFENDVYKCEYFDSSIDKITGYKTNSLLASPIISSTGELFGIVEMLNKHKGDFEKRDLQTINAFATFCSIALEKNQLKTVSNISDLDIELKKWVGDQEKSKYDIPELLHLSGEQIEQVSRLRCFSVDFKGIGHFKELFYFFDFFKFREAYKITNDQFFRFIFAISATYNDVPYHNWTHACDVTQYIFYEVTTAKIQEKLSQLELFVLFIAAICHDANHQGFNNVFNVKAETPLGILFKDQSVMEMHHVEQSIPIIARDDINLFGALDQEDTKKAWNQFVKLILSTDMAHHFEIVKKSQGLVDENKWDWQDFDTRILGMQLILKVADISNVSRPFEYANEWCDILNREFFRQGDLEKSTGIGLTSPLNDRDNSDKPKSQIGFYNFICLPLYSVTAKVYPELQVNVESVKSNLEKWKELAAAKAAAAAPPA
ncbi:3'5'-cyclic nucleotide phosphodiesterase family protein [Tritrichomonas foetus]|uniref:3'5'-cyclic nucleotide phosphodiesterase family protein n=1 Tax=Tritrichomonas foetus TaxID=1144522 RepID=A0A1J4K8R2_9EUKA|nr:3'5'-cyclic nucleotide phosphodiesterase family protein [Tritrichomonas foetus]|eukprot:OHT07889.1 3'5'-cyclic nucleotide phosphodiesterase family protein [Tritrichomonas foetus]